MKFKYLVCSAAMLLALAGCNQPASGGDPVVETISVTGVALNKTTVALTVNQTETLTATITPANATNKNVTWSASGDGVVSVVDGLVRALKPGTSTVTATTVDGGYTANCEVTVSAATVAVTGVTLNKTSLSLTVGDSETLTATVAPSDATNKNVTWSVTGDAVTVTNGTVTAAKAGSATVTVTTVDGGFTANCAVTVEEASTKPVDAADLAYATADTLGEHGDDYCYFNDPEWWSGASAVVNEAYYSPTAGLVFDYTYNPASDPKGNNWSVQLMRKNSSLTVGTMYDLSFKLNSSKAGTIIVNDTNTEIVKGDNNIKVTYRQGEGASFNIQFSFNLIGDARVVITDILWEAALAAPEGVVVSENAGVYTIAFAAVTGADSYKAYYVNTDGQAVESETVTNGGQLTKVSTLPDGKYKVFVTTVKGTKESPYSTSYGQITKGEQQAVVPAGGPKTNMTFGEEHTWPEGVLNLPDDRFVYWNAQWDWSSGAQVNVNEGDAYTEEGTVTATYSSEANSNCAYGFQIFYKNTSLTAGKTYTLSYTLTSTLALNVTANGAEVALEAGVATNVSVEYKENANDASFALVTPVVGAFTNTLVISNISWVEK